MSTQLNIYAYHVRDLEPVQPTATGLLATNDNLFYIQPAQRGSDHIDESVQDWHRDLQRRRVPHRVVRLVPKDGVRKQHWYAIIAKPVFQRTAGQGEDEPTVCNPFQGINRLYTGPTIKDDFKNLR